SIRFSYRDGLLDRAEINHPERVVQFRHDAVGRIIEIRDYSGRSWRYEYDDLGDLLAFITPPTERYRAGLCTLYEYSTPFKSAFGAHNLSRIFDPAGRLYLENEYGDIEDDISFNHVIRQRQGGGESLFEYEAVDQVFEHEYNNQQRPAFQTTQTARNGQLLH